MAASLQGCLSFTLSTDYTSVGRESIQPLIDEVVRRHGLSSSQKRGVTRPRSAQMETERGHKTNDCQRRSRVRVLNGVLQDHGSTEPTMSPNTFQKSSSLSTTPREVGVINDTRPEVRYMLYITRGVRSGILTELTLGMCSWSSLEPRLVPQLT